ncbi:putative bifunctional diguanylate cyclase/phosphodiesterase [Agaribacter marinus]|uniref:Diguanylate cyclase/phosphodiesterase n=1 Tax=Agaribacter marinus TaxID=1431249 RepID=A0AA37WG16_9ALTE|nr:EAL domain-containing protein [Agaribacter marinus]GLR69556.1 hypothetical protein GCM10007852_04640 [Agaribacter marinus]
MTKSLRVEIAVLAFSSITFVSVLTVWLSIASFDTLYQESASKDLNGLSENLAVDLIPSVDEQDEFTIYRILLRLGQYDNVRYAAVLDNDNNVISSYLGRVITNSHSVEEIMSLPPVNYDEYYAYSEGMHQINNNILAKKRIGDMQLPLGYLIIVNDISEPLTKSKYKLLGSVIPWALITMIFAILIILGFQHKALLPLVRLNSFMRKIRETNDYSLVAELKGKQEVRDLTQGLNSMLEAINIEVDKNKQKNRLLLTQQKTMEKLANYDSLTELPNRQFFMQKLNASLEQAKIYRTDIILFFFDLDGFKQVNDSFGHEIGDKLLQNIAEKIVSFVDNNANVARLGGDEFLISFEETFNVEQIEIKAQKFISHLSTPMNIDNWKVQVGTSLGIANAKSANYKISQLITNADVAMYQAKASGRNTHLIFSPAMIETSRRKLNIANNINDGIKENEFSLRYQPKVNSLSEVVGYEALARWDNKKLGNVSPAEFIPVAEQSGKISAITYWLVHQVIQDMQQILDINRKIKVSLNLSAHDLKDTSLVTLVGKLLEKHNINPMNLQFEITESAYLENFELANQFISRIKEMGCSIALDDFGTGYSSLSYLTKIDIDTLKVDKQFIDNICVSERNAIITNIIVDMANALNLEVCVEGVETLEQSDLLAGFGCHTLQGYYFGKPEPLNSVLTALQK